MTTSTTTRQTHVENLTKAVSQYLTAGVKFSKAIIAVCELPKITTIEEKSQFCEEVAQILTTARQQGAAKMEKISKEFTNAWGYAGRIAGAQLGVKFTYQQHAGFYKVESIAAQAPKDPQTSGIETDPAITPRLDADMAGAVKEEADSNPTLPLMPESADKSQAASQARRARTTAAKKGILALLTMGLTIEEIASALEKEAHKLAKEAADIAPKLEKALAA